MEIKQIENKDVWDGFLKKYQPNTLLQSWNWINFSQNQGQKVFPLGLFAEDKLIGTALFTKIESRRGNYLVTHGGPMINWQHRNAFDTFHEYVKGLSIEENVDFFRIRPPLLHSTDGIAPFIQKGYRLAPMYFQAEHTMLLDLSLDEEEILRGMRKQTRYYVRKADKEGVTVRFSQDPGDLELLYKLYLETVNRQKFVPYQKEYFENEFNSFAEDGLVDLVFGYHQDRLLSAAMVLYCDQTAYYHHGASIRKNPDVFASYKVQWEIIKNAKERGISCYDFWGVAPSDDKTHPRAGLTTFKRGFGGERIRWMHTLDFPISWKYWPMYAYVKYERWRRGL